MLILTRRLGENIRIGDNIKVTFLGMKGNHVRLGIDAPSDVTVHREEIYERIRRENKQASKGKGSGYDMALKILSGGNKE